MFLRNVYIHTDKSALRREAQTSSTPTEPQIYRPKVKQNGGGNCTINKVRKTKHKFCVVQMRHIY
jgi:hypothetical protein